MAGIFFSGYSTSNDGDVSGNHGSLDSWVVKLQSNGTIDWQKSFGGSGIDYGVFIKQTHDGYILGSSSYSADGDITNHHGTTSKTDIWVVKIDNSGTLQWQKSLGGDGFDFISAIDVTMDDGFVIAGKSDSTSGDVSGNHGGDDGWVVKLDSAGAIEWQKSFGGTKGDAFLSIKQTSDGGYAMAGVATSNDGDVSGHHGTTTTTDYWVVKLHSNGNLDWQKSFGGTGNDGGTGIWQNSDGGYFVAGHSFSNDGDITGHHGATSTSDYWLLKLDSAGALQWQTSLGGTSDETNAVWANQQTSDNGYIIAGKSLSTDGDVTGHHGTTSVADYWVVKLAGAPLGVDDSYNSFPSKFALNQNYPNPFNPSTKITFDVPVTGFASLKIFDVLGREVAVPVNQTLTAGSYDVVFDANGLTSGVYFYRLTAGEFTQTRKLLLQR